MLRIAICDDEARILEEISVYLKKYSARSGKTNLEVFPFSSAGLLLNSIDRGEMFDIYLLDVYIGEEMGTSLAREIRARDIASPIVFLTTSVDHAPESLEYDTLRYLIKPIKEEKLNEGIDVAIQKAEKLSSKFILLKTENGIENINVNNILYTESRSHYQYVNFTDGSQVRSRMTVSDLFLDLSQHGGFVRGGSAYIINLNKVKSVSTREVCFNNNKKLMLPRGAHVEIKEAFWLLQYEGQEG